MSEQEMIEALAAAEHASWARWMAYLFSKSPFNPAGHRVIPEGLVRHWQQQIDTSYADLTEREKQSDRNEVAHILPIINSRIAALEAENARLRASLADIDPPIMRLQDAAQRAEVAEAERDALRAALEDIAQTTGRVGLFPTDTLIEILDVARAALAASTGEG